MPKAVKQKPKRKAPAPAPAPATASSSSPFAAASTDKANPPVFFWKLDEKPYGLLCQWYESPFEHDGIRYHTAEMWMMIQKAKLFGDEEIAAQMAEVTNPRTHKALGRKVRNFNEKVWNENRLRIVEEGNWLKFTVTEDADSYRQILLDTGDRELVEASPLDRVWGIGFGAAKAEANRKRWGYNLLGIALMNVRKRLRARAGEAEAKDEVEVAVAVEA